MLVASISFTVTNQFHRVIVVWGVHGSPTHVHDVVPPQLYLLPPHSQGLGCLIPSAKKHILVSVPPL